MTTKLNPLDFKNYGFSFKPIYLCLKEYTNGYREAIATYERWNVQLYTVRNKIKENFNEMENTHLKTKI